MTDDRHDYPEDQHQATDHDIASLILEVRGEGSFINGNTLEYAGLGGAHLSGWGALLNEPCVLGCSNRPEDGNQPIFEVDTDKLMQRMSELHGQERVYRIMLELEET